MNVTKQLGDIYRKDSIASDSSNLLELRA